MASSDANTGPPKKKSKTILSYFAKKTTANEIGESPSVCTPESPPKQSTSEATTAAKKAIERQFQDSWLRIYSWLEYDKNENYMTCKTCKKHQKSNTFTDGNRNFRTTTLNRHADSVDHKAAVLSESMKGTMQKSVDKILTQKESAALVALKSTFWMVKEDIAISKHESLLDFLKEVNCPNAESLQATSTVDYSSDKSATDFISSLAFVAREKVDKYLQDSPFISLLCDESTDISVQKKLVVYARVLDSKTFKPSTLFLTNVRVDSGTGEAIFTELKSLLDKKKISASKVMGLGTDGAKVMTGTGKGVTGFMLRENPMLINYHCLAHKLALVTSQAANEVTYLQEYQTVLTGLFYYFKSSAKRCDQLTAVQKMLEEPELRVKEVHEVRWLSTYIAIQTVYTVLDSLITFFVESKDAKAKGFSKKLSSYDFIASTYLLMDVLPIVSHMCLIFQKSNVDVSQVKIEIDHTKKELNKIKNGEAGEERMTYLQQLQNDHLNVQNGKLTFKGNHIVHGKQNIDCIKEKFIDKLLEKINERFPDNDSNIIYAFAVLSMRPLTFLSVKERETWGNEKIDLLIQQYGTVKESQSGTKQDPIIDAHEAKVEWSKVKELVIQEGYTRDKMEVLWSQINAHHRDDYPNMMTLAALALTAPIHTADCERGFSAQNQIKTPQRNRLSPETVDDLMMVKVVGGDMKNFDFLRALEHWRTTKSRKLFCA